MSDIVIIQNESGGWSVYIGQTLIFSSLSHDRVLAFMATIK